MLLLLPSAWLACLFLCRELAARGRITPDWRLSFILASAAWGAMLVLATESLSLATAIDTTAVGCFWLLANIVLWGVLWRCHRQSPDTAAGWTFSGIIKSFRAWPLDARILLAAALLFALFLGAIALFTPNTNLDSVTYHLPRVMHWMQNRSVNHYPTNADAQLQMGPWAAFIQLHLWLLWDSDLFENMPQWLAMLGSMIVATLLVTQLLPAGSTAGPRAQAFAALLVVTLPTGIVESITAQTDYVTGFWFLCLASLAVAWCRDSGNLLYAAGFGVALGLGMLAKFTLILFAAPVGFATAGVLLWKSRRNLPILSKRAFVSLGLCLALSLPHFLRNQALYGSFIGSQAVQAGTRVAQPSIGGVVLNVLHNAELHTNTGIEPLTTQINRLLHFLERCTGHRVDDPALSQQSSMYEAPDQLFVFDSFAASPWHVLLAIAAVIAGLACPRRNWLALGWTALAFAGCVLFCAVVIWQIWGCRYHLPELLLFMPLTAVLLVPRLPRWLPSILAAGLMLFAFVIVANNRSRPVFDRAWWAKPRIEKMLSFQEEREYGPLKAMTAQIADSGCRDVGLKLEIADSFPEYAIWLLLRDDGFHGRIRHVFPEGPSRRLPEPDALPDAIVCTPSIQPVGDMSGAFPTSTEFGIQGNPPLFKVFWSREISARRANTAK